MLRLRNRSLCTFAAAALAAGAVQAQSVNDTALFTAVVPPNVMLLVDNSGSMNTVVWYPGYDPSAVNTCNYFDNNTVYRVRAGVGWDTNLLNDEGFGVRRFRPGTYTLPGAPAGCVNTALEIYSDAAVDPIDYTRWDGHYLNWYFSTANAAAARPPANCRTCAGCRRWRKRRSSRRWCRPAGSGAGRWR